MDIVTHKKCSKCKEWKPRSEFYKDASKKDGLRWWCKVCAREGAHKRYKENPEKKREHVRKWRKENPEKQRAYRRRWEKENPEKIKSKDHRRRALKAGNGGSFTAEEWIKLCERYDNKCLCCGEKKKLAADHVKPLKLGGTSNIDNIQPLCKPCNSSKGAKEIDYRPKMW